MVDWNTGEGNARFRILELLKNNFGPGDKLVPASAGAYVHALGFISPNGEHKILVINKRDREVELTLPQAAKQVEFVDQISAGKPPVLQEVNSATLQLRGLEVAVVTLQ
jgi:hypothetical protein